MSESLPPDLEEKVLDFYESTDDPTGPGLDELCQSHPEHEEQIRGAVFRAIRILDGMSVPEAVGPYEVKEKLGEGGMGVVYLAMQTEPIKREVALKVIKLGMDSRRVLARFEFERQTLARMDHPGIARILDAGVTERGSPFFTMDYVKGVPITSFCRAKALSEREVLRLFSKVCVAVQHAHQKGVIHRDLKPSNVLVSEDDGGVIHRGTPIPWGWWSGRSRCVGTGYATCAHAVSSLLEEAVTCPEHVVPFSELAG